MLGWAAVDWDCEAYGSKGREIGALCFFGRDGDRRCLTDAECRIVMRAERQRVWTIVQEKAAAGDPDFVYLAGQLTNPDQILHAAE